MPVATHSVPELLLCLQSARTVPAHLPHHLMAAFHVPLRPLLKYCLAPFLSPSLEGPPEHPRMGPCQFLSHALLWDSLWFLGAVISLCQRPPLTCTVAASAPRAEPVR